MTEPQCIPIGHSSNLVFLEHFDCWLSSIQVFMQLFILQSTFLHFFYIKLASSVEYDSGTNNADRVRPIPASPVESIDFTTVLQPCKNILHRMTFISKSYSYYLHKHFLNSLHGILTILQHFPKPLPS